MTGISHYYSTPSVACSLWDEHSGFSRPKISQYIRKIYFINLKIKIALSEKPNVPKNSCPMADVARVYSHALEQC